MAATELIPQNEPNANTWFRRAKLWLAAAPIVVLTALSLLCWDQVLLTLLAIPVLVAYVAAALAVRNCRGLMLSTAAIALVLSIVCCNSPLRLAFACSQPHLDRLACELEQGAVPAAPFWGGVFRVQRAEIGPEDTVCFWIDVRPSGKAGFIRTSQHRPPFNLWADVPLNENWRFIRED